MQQLMRQAQKMQQDMARVQSEMEVREFEATAGGGMVTAVVTGSRQLVRLSINPQAVDPEDVEMLQDLVLAAVNEALRTAEETMNAEMGKLTGGTGMPGLF
jgi:DNA-binding YbaB/EbfC family protein